MTLLSTQTLFTALAWAVLLSSTGFAQLGRLEQCLPIPSYGRELDEYREELRTRNLAQMQVIRVQFEGRNRLSPQALMQLSTGLKTHFYDSGPDWTTEIVERTLEVWQEHGYFKAAVKVTTKRLSGNAANRKFAVSIAVDEGPQYRLDQISFSSSSLFSSSELRKLFPIQDGAILDVARLRAGIEELRKLYGSRGHINFTAAPDVTVDDLKHTVSFNVELDEGKLYRISELKFLGLEKPVADRLSKYPALKSGMPYNSIEVEKFFRENKSVLPPDASPEYYSSIQRDDIEHTVSLVFDLRRCPVISDNVSAPSEPN